MSGRLQAYLHACALALLVVVTAAAAYDRGLASDTLGAGLVVLAHLAVWARASSMAFAQRSEAAARSLGVRPLLGIPLFFVIVLLFGPIPSALAGAMVAGGALLLGGADAVQRHDVRGVAAERAALLAEARC